MRSYEADCSITSWSRKMGRWLLFLRVGLRVALMDVEVCSI